MKFHILCFTILVTAALATMPAAGWGQSNVAAWDAFARSFDRNGDGLIDPREIRYVPPPTRELLVARGVDLSRPISPQILQQATESFLEEAQSRSADGEDRRQAKPSRLDNRRTSENFRNHNQVAGDRSRARVVRAAVTYQLPEMYRALDTNGDGQIGLYEWPRSDLATFCQIDRNDDGLLTPWELIQASDPKVNLADAQRSQPGSRMKAAPPSQTAASRERDPRAAAFESLDRNRDGSLDQDEWARSRLTRARFEEAQFSVSFPLSRDTFVEQYAQALAASGVVSSR